MPPAARIGDMHTCPMVTPGTPPIPHVGGPITTGFPTVMIGGMPAARVTDMAVCVGPPDTIAKGSMTVMIGSMPAARMGDNTMHGGVIVMGCPTVMIGDAGSGGGGAPSPAQPSVPAVAGGAPSSVKKGEFAVGGDRLLGGQDKAGELSAFYARGKGSVGAEKGVGIGGEIEAGVLQGKLRGGLGPDENNPFVSVEVEGNVVQGKAKADLLIGDDGRRVGVVAKGGVGFTSAGADLKVEYNIPIPFTDWSISYRPSAGVSAPGSLGIAAGGHAYYDKKEQRAHLGGGVGGKLGVGGVDVGIDISIGKRYKSKERLE